MLSRVLDVAVEYGLAERNAVTAGKHWQKQNRTAEDSDNWLEPEDEWRLVQWLLTHWQDEPVKRLALITALVAGLRFSEVRELQTKDLVEVPQRGLFVRRSRSGRRAGRPKNKRARFQPLPKPLFEELQELAAASTTEVLFTPPKATYLPNNTLNRWLTKACHGAGVRRVTMHGLKHTAGTSYGSLGRSQKEIAHVLGHLNVKSSERYVHAADRVKPLWVNERWENITRLDDVRTTKEKEDAGS